jgi:hypothetical protein
MGSKLLIASIFAGLLAGTESPLHKIVDDPPGSLYQTQGIRASDEGVRARESLEPVRNIPSAYVRAAQAVCCRGGRRRGSRGVWTSARDLMITDP